MDALLFHFPVSGVETYLFVPFLVMFIISTGTSMGGVSGAFILLPFQMSVLGYTSPGVSATNFVYNIVSIPLGVFRMVRDKRLCWTLFWLLVIGTLPGVFFGYLIRVLLLPDPSSFRPFVGLVLGYLAIRTLQAVLRQRRQGKASASSGTILGGQMGVRTSTIDVEGETFRFATLPLLGLSLIVGVVGGAYGIGGGAVMAPFCIAVLGLPPFTVAGAALASTWVTSCVGVVFYMVDPVGANNASPDWLLGSLFGLGGMAGIYLGARLQGLVPAIVIKLLLAVALLYIALRYIIPWVTAFVG